jgi:hypothetical protein
MYLDVYHRGIDGIDREGGHTGQEPRGGSGSMKDGDASSQKGTTKGHGHNPAIT